jgi:LAO/AO transport system kinase
MTMPSRVAQLAQGLAAGDRRALSQAITLIESTNDADRAAATELLATLQRPSVEAFRIGVTGAPGVGKSTFIDAFGMTLIAAGQRVAVLSVDPSAIQGGGSILADKTRMSQLATHSEAFIRPSPSRSSVGGIASSTAEAVQLCEAAGYQAVIVESVGVGQQAHDIRHVVDFLVLLVEPGAGDQLQGLKRGILEVVDCVAVNKADGSNVDLAEQTRAEYAAALAAFTGANGPAVLTLSALEKRGLDPLWQLVQDQRTRLQRDGELLQRRGEQRAAVFWQLLREQLVSQFVSQATVARRKEELLEQLQGNAITPRAAVQELLRLLVDQK